MKSGMLITFLTVMYWYIHGKFTTIFIFFWVGSGDYTWKDVNVSNFIPFCPITSLFVPLHPSSDITQPLYFGEKYSLKSSFYLQSFSIPYNLYKLLLCGILLMQFLKAFVGWTSQRTVLLVLVGHFVFSFLNFSTVPKNIVYFYEAQILQALYKSGKGKFYPCNAELYD